MVQFKSTTTPKSERLLAHTLGYPITWHVVRTSPHPILNKPNTFQDIIYAGDPQIADAYFNHTAAMDAAMRWKEDGGGGDAGSLSTRARKMVDEAPLETKQAAKWRKEAT